MQWTLQSAHMTLNSQASSELTLQQDPFPQPCTPHPPPCSLSLCSVMSLLCSSVTAATPVAPGQIFPLGNAGLGEKELCWGDSALLTPALGTAGTFYMFFSTTGTHLNSSWAGKGPLFPGGFGSWWMCQSAEQSSQGTQAGVRWVRRKREQMTR